MARRFYLSEAETLLPQVSTWIREAVALKSECQEAENKIEALTQKITLMGGVVVDRERAQAARERRDDKLALLKSVVERIHETGCLVKDLDKGLVDFPTLFRGEEVYLCWMMNEPGIEFWHKVEDGFAGRKQIDDDFRENHRGDPLT
jgi:hypothetical protein